MKNGRSGNKEWKRKIIKKRVGKVDREEKENEKLEEK